MIVMLQVKSYLRMIAAMVYNFALNLERKIML
jgi:hypothetical protein